MNKLTKLLSVFVIAGAVGTGVTFAAGCGHKHSYSDDWSTSETHHWHQANCHDVKKDEGEHDFGGDLICDTCGYDKTETEKPPVEDPEEDGDALKLNENVISFDKGESKELELKLDDSYVNQKIFIRVADATIKSGDKQVESLEVTYTKGLKVTVTYTGLEKGEIKVEVAPVIAMGEKSITVVKGNNLYAVLPEESVTSIDAAVIGVTDGKIGFFSRNNESNATLSATNTIDVENGVAIVNVVSEVEGSKTVTLKITETEAVDPDFNGTILKLDQAAEFSAEGEDVVFCKIALNKGSYTLNFTDCDDVDNVYIEMATALNSDGDGIDYDKQVTVENGAFTLEEDSTVYILLSAFDFDSVSGKITVKEAEAEEEIVYETIYENDYRGEGVTVGESTGFPTAGGVYGYINNEEPDATKTSVTIANGKVVLTDKSTTDTVRAYIRLDNVVSLKKVIIEASVTHTDSSTAGNWSFLTLCDENGNEIISLRSDSNDSKKIKVYRDALKNEASKGYISTASVAYSVTDPITAKIELDLVNGTATVTVLNTVLGENMSITATSFAGIGLVTAGGERNVTLDSLVVKTADAKLAEVQNVLGAKLNAEYAKYETTHTGAQGELVEAAFIAGKTAITAANATVESIATAYNTAIAAMADVISTADIDKATATSAFAKALADIKVETDKRTIADVVLGTATVTGNKAAVDAIDLNLDNITTYSALKTWKESKLAAIAEIKDDSQIIADVKAAVKANVDDLIATAKENLTDDENKTTEASLDTLSAGIKDKVDGVEVSATKKVAAVIAELVKINGEIQTQIDKAIADASKDLPTLVSDYTKELNDYASGKLTAESDQDLIDAVNAARDAAIAALSAETAKENMINVLNNGKDAIDKAVTDYNNAKELAAAKQTAISELDKYKADELAKLEGADATIFDDISYDAIDNAQSPDEVETKTAEIKEEIDNAVKAYKDALALAEAKETAKSALDEYKDEKLEGLQGANATIFDAINYDAIDNAKSIEELATAKTKIEAAIDKAVEDFMNQSFTVTVKYNNVKYNVFEIKYGEKLTVGNVKFTGFTVTKAEIEGDEIPADGKAIYSNTTVDVIDIEEDESNFAAGKEWKPTQPAENAVLSGAFESNDLFTLTVNGKNASKQTSDKTRTIGDKTFTSSIGLSAGTVSSNPNGNKDNPFIITVNANLKTLIVYISLTDSAGTGNNRAGTIYCITNDGEAVAIKEELTAKDNKADMSIAYAVPAEALSAGTQLKFYGVNINGSGATLCLYGIDAEIDETAIPNTVNVTWEGVEGVHSYRYNEEIEAPTPTLADNEKFNYWFYYDEDGVTEIKWEDGTKLPTGNYTFRASISTVTVGTIEILSDSNEVEIGKSITLSAIVKDDGGNEITKAVTWDLGGYTGAEIDANGKLTLNETAAADDTITVKATIGEIESNTITITVKAVSQKPWTLDLTKSEATVAGSNKTISNGKGVKMVDGVATVCEANDADVMIVNVAACKFNRSGYMEVSSSASFTVTVESACKLKITCNKNDSRSFFVKQGDTAIGNADGYLSSTSEITIELPSKGTYTVSTDNTIQMVTIKIATD